MNMLLNVNMNESLNPLDINEYKKAVNTNTLLYGLSSRLSSRKDCRGKNYRISVGIKDPEISILHTEKDMICINEDVWVYSDRYNRKLSDKIPILDHMMRKYFSDYFIENGYMVGRRSVGIKNIDNIFLCGIYEYRSSSNNKRRRWFRIK